MKKVKSPKMKFEFYDVIKRLRIKESKHIIKEINLTPKYSLYERRSFISDIQLTNRMKNNLMFERKPLHILFRDFTFYDNLELRNTKVI